MKMRSVVMLAVALPMGIFVSPDGDDAAEGTFEAPVRTLARAVKIAAEPSRRKSVKTVYLRGGEYPLAETVVFGPEMSGTIVRAYGDERPVLTGATRVRGFGPVTDSAMKARFPEAVREKVREADVKALGYRGFEPHAPSGLFYSSAIRKTEPVRRANALYLNGRRLTLARSPNEGFVRIDEVLDATGHVFRASVPEMAKLGKADAPDLVACGYYQYFWDDENVSAEVTDPACGVVKIDWLSGREVKKDQTLFFRNAPALLDRPGEWYLDRASGKLYVLPSVEAAGEYVLAGFAGPFLRLAGCRDVSVMGLVFEYGRGDAVVIEDAERVEFAGNVVRNFGGIALQATGRDLRIAGNVLHGFGFDAMRVTGGNRETLEPSGIVVEGNDVSDSGFVQRCYTPGILLNGCGTKIVRNRFHDIPSSAMRVEGNDYDIVSNLIERVVTESDDQGGSDTYGNPSYAGTVYRYNVWTDIVSEGVAPCGRAGIRFDDAISNQKVYGNRFHNCSVGHFGGVQIHGGRCNLVSNNLFTACKYGVSVTPWTAERWHAQLDEYRIKRGVSLDLPVYVRRYPGIGRLYDTPMTNTVCCNVMVGVEKDVYSWKLPDETAVWGNGVFKTMPGEEGLKTVAGFEMPPTAEEVGPCPDEPCLKRARRNDAARAGSPSDRAEIAWTKSICVEPDRYIGWPTVCRLRNGDLVAVFSGDRDGHICPYGKVQLVRSTDGGETWSAPKTIANGILDDRDAGVVQLPNGEIVVTWFTSIAFNSSEWLVKQHPEYRRHFEKLPPELVEANLGYYLIRSADNGETWSKPLKLENCDQTPHGPIVLRDGSLLQIGRRSLGDGFAAGKDVYGKTIISVSRSTDGGRTWSYVCPEIPASNGENDVPHMFHEPHVAELPDGTLVGMVRYHGDDGDPLLRKNGHMRITFSKDGGKTWTPMAKTPLLGLPPHLLALPDGRLVCAYGRRVGEYGFGEFAAVSDDGGRTWDTANEIMLAPSHNGDLGYPASTLLADGWILTVFYQQLNPGENTRLMATKWRLK